MNIAATIEGLQYQPFLQSALKAFEIELFDINLAPGSCIVRHGSNEFAISKWISPKRTRSYPYARVYDTISRNKRITVIPIVKDEGLAGDRDFIQWDTISLMSLLEVYVIFGYYDQAIKNHKRENKITKQKFNNEFIIEKLEELTHYQSSALHWNLKELRETLPKLVDRQAEAYSRIQKQTGVKLKSFSAFTVFKKEIENNTDLFMESSRQRASQAQSREIQTIHANEYLETITKTSITISNYIGGKYFFTVDEVMIQNGVILLIESKHSNKTILPSLSDIKDGLLKMILYSNLSHVMRGGDTLPSRPILKLTSATIQSYLNSDADEAEIIKFSSINQLNPSKRLLIQALCQEAKQNHFTIQLSQKTC